MKNPALDMVKIIKKNIFSLILILSIFFLDRLSKIIIINIEPLYGIKSYPVFSFLNFELVWNDGIAFGLLSFNDKFYYNFITLVIIIVTLVILFLMIKSSNLEK